jgi:polar amino acid transport system substrate-binding protein
MTLALAFGPLLCAAPIRIGIEPLAAQLSHVDAQGRPVGFAVDIAQAVALDQALEVEFVTKPWGELLEDFRAARIEVLAAVGATPERDAFLTYSAPHIDLRSALFTRRDFKVPSDIRQLGQAVFGTTPKSLSADYLIRRGWNNIRSFPSLHGALQALDRGECDLVIAVGIIARRQIIESKLTRIVETDFELPDLHFELRFGVAPENRALLYRLNNGLARVRASPAYDQIYEKWIGVLEPRRIRLRDAQPYLIALGALALAVAAAFLWQRRLLQRLARQADELRQRQEQLMLVLEGSDDGFWDRLRSP